MGLLADVSFGSFCGVASMNEIPVEPEIIKPEIRSYRTKTSKEAVEITNKINQPSFFERAQKFFLNWLVTKGWIYIMVFIMGYLFGGLMWK